MEESQGPLNAIARITDVSDTGWVADDETGEILGHIAATERFAVDTVETAEWVLKLRSEIDAEIAAIDLRREALVKHLGDLRSRALRRLSFWDYRFAPSLIAFARSQLSGNSRTARFSWGSVGFRRAPGTHQILDMDAAVEWMWTYAPHKVKFKRSVNVKDVLEVRAALAKEYDEDPQHLPWLSKSDEGVNVRISTGIDVKAREEK
jgi:hypothetical protein